VALKPSFPHRLLYRQALLLDLKDATCRMFEYDFYSELLRSFIKGREKEKQKKPLEDNFTKVLKLFAGIKMRTPS